MMRARRSFLTHEKPGFFLMKTAHKSIHVPRDVDLRNYVPFEKVKEDPAFQGKKSSHPLVLADFVSFVTKRALTGDPHIGRFYEPWRKRDIRRKIVMPP